jgi:hypothetical protein
MKKTVIASLLLAVLAGCSKEKAPLADRSQEAPMVKIIKPTQPGFYRQGENICITANASSQNQLSRITLSIMHTATGKTCFSMDYPLNSKTFLLDTEVPVNRTMSGNCSIQLQARDVFGNTTTVKQSVAAE